MPLPSRRPPASSPTSRRFPFSPRRLSFTQNNTVRILSPVSYPFSSDYTSAARPLSRKFFEFFALRAGFHFPACIFVRTILLADQDQRPSGRHRDGGVLATWRVAAHLPAAALARAHFLPRRVRKAFRRKTKGDKVNETAGRANAGAKNAAGRPLSLTKAASLVLRGLSTPAYSGRLLHRGAAFPKRGSLHWESSFARARSRRSSAACVLSCG